jgi:hypothetical protein
MMSDLFISSPDASGTAVEGAYRILAAEMDAGTATAASSVQQSAPTRNLGEPADAVPNEECKWACLIAHHQAVAVHQVRWLGEKIEKKLTERAQRLTAVWIDKQERATLDGMNEGVRLSRNFILFLTKDVLTREFCLSEIRIALKLRKNVILVFQTNERYGGVPGSFSEYYYPELKKAFPHAEDYDWLLRNGYVEFHDRAEHVDVMLCDAQCKNGIIDQMELDEAESQKLLFISQPSADGSDRRTFTLHADKECAVECGDLSLHFPAGCVSSDVPCSVRRVRLSETQADWGDEFVRQRLMSVAAACSDIWVLEPHGLAFPPHALPTLSLCLGATSSTQTFVRIESAYPLPLSSHWQAVSGGRFSVARALSACPASRATLWRAVK